VSFVGAHRPLSVMAALEAAIQERLGGMSARVPLDGRVEPGHDVFKAVRDVLQQLPMEFMAESQKLIGISLEGSVG
jgi:hypothetical protein